MAKAGQSGNSQVTRRPNFTEAEETALTNAVEIKKVAIFCKFKGQVGKVAKRQKWQEITDCVNKVSTSKRTVQELQAKWKNIKAKCKGVLSTKMSRSFMSKTGGGPPKEPLSSMDVRMLGIIGRDAVFGIDGGFDTSDMDSADEQSRPLEVGADFAMQVEELLALDNPNQIYSLITSSQVVPLAVQNTPAQPTMTGNQNSAVVDNVLSVPSQNQVTNVPVHQETSGSLNASARLPRMSANTKLVLLQEKILDKISGLKDISKERLEVEKQRLKVEEEKLALLKSLVSASPGMVIREIS